MQRHALHRDELGGGGRAKNVHNSNYFPTQKTITPNLATPAAREPVPAPRPPQDRRRALTAPAKECTFVSHYKATYPTPTDVLDGWTAWPRCSPTRISLWLAFFLRGVCEVSQSATDTARAILELRERHRHTPDLSPSRQTCDSALTLSLATSKLIQPPPLLPVGIISARHESRPERARYPARA